MFMIKQRSTWFFHIVVLHEVQLALVLLFATFEINILLFHVYLMFSTRMLAAVCGQIVQKIFI